MDPQRFKKYKLNAATNSIEGVRGSVTYKPKPTIPVSRPVHRSTPTKVDISNEIVKHAADKVYGFMGYQNTTELTPSVNQQKQTDILNIELKKTDSKLKNNLLRTRIKKFKYWRELRFFLSGASLAMGLASFGYYIYFSNPISKAEVGATIVSVNADGTETHTTDTGESVNVSPGVDPSKVDTRPPKPIEPDMPKRLIIPAMKLNASVRSLGLAKDGSLAVPNYFNQVGWYDKSARPGNIGTIVVDGHYDINDDGAVFKKINVLDVGSEIQVMRGDGQIIKYYVESKILYDKNAVPMEKVIGSDGKERLNIITCFGNWIQSEKTYHQRMVIYAVRI